MLLQNSYLYVPLSLAASSLTLTICKKYNCAYFKTYVYTRVRNVSCRLSYSFMFFGSFYHFLYGCMFCVLLFNYVSYVFLRILIVIYSLFCIFCFDRANWHFAATLTEVFPCFFLSCKANARL